MNSRQAERERARAHREAAERERALREGRRRRLRLLAAVSVLAAGVVGAAVAASGGGGHRPAPGEPVAGASDVDARFRGIPQHGVSLGAPAAPVTMVEFADLKCPVCRQYSLRVLPTLLDRYVRTGKVRMVFRNVAFVGEQYAPGDSHAAARMAAATSLQDRLWQFADLFYRNQQDETSRYVTDELLRRLGSAVPGLDVGRALAERQSPAVRRQLDQAEALFERHGLTGTPSFLLARRGQGPTPLRYDSLDVSSFAGPIDRLLGR